MASPRKLLLSAAWPLFFVAGLNSAKPISIALGKRLLPHHEAI
jgi:hypothetical protein